MKLEVSLSAEQKLAENAAKLPRLLQLESAYDAIAIPDVSFILSSVVAVVDEEYVA